jgi:hypothetical protein
MDEVEIEMASGGASATAVSEIRFSTICPSSISNTWVGIIMDLSTIKMRCSGPYEMGYCWAAQDVTQLGVSQDHCHLVSCQSYRLRMGPRELPELWYTMHLCLLTRA